MPNILYMPLYILCGEFLFCLQLCLRWPYGASSVASRTSTISSGILMMKASTPTQEIVDSRIIIGERVAAWMQAEQ